MIVFRQCFSILALRPGPCTVDNTITDANARTVIDMRQGIGSIKQAVTFDSHVHEDFAVDVLIVKELADLVEFFFK